MAGYGKLSRDQLLQLVQAKDELIKLRESQLERLEKRLEHSEDERRALETQLSGFIAQVEVRARQSAQGNDCAAGDRAAGSSSSGKSENQTNHDKKQITNASRRSDNDAVSVDSRSMMTDITPDEVRLGSDGCGFPFARTSLGALDQQSALAAVVRSARTSMPLNGLDDVQSIAESQEVDFQALERMCLREDQEGGQDQFNIQTFPDVHIDSASRPSGTFSGENLKEVGAFNLLQTVEEEKQSSACSGSSCTWPANVKTVDQLIRTDPDTARKLCVFVWGFREKPVWINDYIANKLRLSHPFPAKAKAGYSRFKGKGGCATVGCHDEGVAAAVLSAFPDASKLWEDPEWSGVSDETQDVDNHWGESKTASASKHDRWDDSWQRDDHSWETYQEEYDSRWNEYYEDDDVRDWKNRGKTLDAMARLNSAFGLRPWPLWKSELQADRIVSGEELWRLRAAGVVQITKYEDDAKLTWNENKIRSALAKTH